MRRRRRKKDVAAVTNTLLYVLPSPPFPLELKTKHTVPALALSQQNSSASIFLFLSEICNFLLFTVFVYLSIYLNILSNKNINTLKTYSNEKGHPITHFFSKNAHIYPVFIYLRTAGNQQKVTFGLLLKQKTDTNAYSKEIVSGAELGDPIMVGFIPVVEIT